MPCKTESCLKTIRYECGCKRGKCWIIILVSWTSQAPCMWDGSPPASNIQHTSFPFLCSAPNHYNKKVLWLIAFAYRQKEQQLCHFSGSMLHGSMLNDVSNVPGCARDLLHAEFPPLRSATTDSWLAVQPIMQIIRLLVECIIQDIV